ncbi:UDP-2,3-diacylglucosamine pyrophosphatase LpxG [Phycisphaerales bacterium]|nr:UDP-2,3-diacylglucosamine pyrophosphatase LpxG [Phycisphaerales bacterium]
MLAGFVALHLLGYAWVIFARRGFIDTPAPQSLIATAYIWSTIVLPLSLLASAAIGVAGGSMALLSKAKRRIAPGPSAQPSPQPPGISRRQALAGMVVGIPAVAQAGAVSRGLAQLNELRESRFDLAFPDLLPSLDGVTIAHVTDTHVGRFTRGPILDAIAARVNAMHPDFVAFTGDLIDYSLEDLPEAIRFLRLLKPRVATAICEGNHDLFSDAQAFRKGVRDAGFPLLRNDSATHALRGSAIQFLGIGWNSRRLADDVANVAALRQPGAFPILLAHHPHAFDPAAAAGLPLTLSGHTHGGQLMLTGEIGAGPALFRYWSGLYRKPGSSLIVSNGAGNWFPLRINAPAEIALITLRTA